MKSPSTRSPVFVDSTGQRHRRIRRTAVWLAVPAVGYLVLLTSSLLGGPRVDTPLIPLPEAAKHQPAPRVTPGPIRAVETPEPGETARSSTEPTAGDHPTQPPPAGPASTQPTTTAQPTTTPQPTSSVTPTITPGPPEQTPGHGKPTAPPGRTKSPSKP
ncbi:hypothetical protein F1D05_24160 [Kribbella qitaiheensis]|uniref:Uncharacterized protein n=1 Tax=Kribbella qitaiheensis TaxID=1544730 RepID=A0A7G6X2H2_9ACTN|nr:hypothetical protein [Kribbella qitaiheensis]QNE20437.1 hypothetical protein F1D05_24160 [Kribbella qitaiheensis]